MLQSYLSIYQIALDIGRMRYTSEIQKGSGSYQTKLLPHAIEEFRTLVERLERVCNGHGLTQTSDFARRILGRPTPDTHIGVFAELDHLSDALCGELEREAVFRVAPTRKAYYEQDELFGPGVANAFPSCARDIRKAGTCFALEQEDGCVHHLMLTLERGLKALAVRVGVPFQHSGWQNIINGVAARLNATPRDPNRAFYVEVNAQFGFLKDAYRNHSEHSHDDPYDMEKALSIFNHVRSFMQALQKGGLTE